MSRRRHKIISIIFDHLLAEDFNFGFIGANFLYDLILARAWDGRYLFGFGFFIETIRQAEGFCSF
jgi:hypothetical protein